MPEPWSEEVERIFTFSTHQRDINEIDSGTLQDANYSLAQLRETFTDGFLAHSDEEPPNKRDYRDDYFYWIDYLGYDITEFDWHAWREYMGYE